MTRITITVEGELEEITPILGKLGELNGISVLKNTTMAVSGREWTKDRILLIWNDISENAKTIFGIIARNDEKSWEEQLNLIGQSANEVGGSLSSLGAQLRNHGLKGITKPLFDNKAGGFRLLPEWKQIVIEKTDEL